MVLLVYSSGDVVVYAELLSISALFWTTPTVFSNATLTRNLTELTCAALIGHNSNAAPGCGSINYLDYAKH